MLGPVSLYRPPAVFIQCDPNQKTCGRWADVNHSALEFIPSASHDNLGSDHQIALCKQAHPGFGNILQIGDSPVLAESFGPAHLHEVRAEQAVIASSLFHTYLIDFDDLLVQPLSRV